MSEIELETYIPFRRRALVQYCLEDCLNDGKLNATERKSLENFCELLSAYFHFDYQKQLEQAKRAYTPLNPDLPAKPLKPTLPQTFMQCRQDIAKLVGNFLNEANFTPLAEEELNRALLVESLVPLKTRVDFEDFDDALVFFRDETTTTIKVKRFFRSKELPIRNLSRVVLLLSFKERSHFESKYESDELEELGFTPGKSYLYLYKNVPRSDLELLFPNVKVTMNIKDRLMFALPAIGAIVPIILKILPSMALLAAAIILMLFGTGVVQNMGLATHASDSIYPVLTAALTVGIGLGGFAVKQYLGYKGKRLKFLKKVTDTLFFKCLVTNEGVLHTLIDATEEEVCKEIILIYYHLLTANKPMTRDELDRHIETWLQNRFSTEIDFDIDKGLTKIATLDQKAKSLINVTVPTLVSEDEQGYLRAAPIGEALMLVDSLWDNAFPYAAKNR